MKSKSQLNLIYLLTCLILFPLLALSGYYVYKSRMMVISNNIQKLHAVALSKQVTLETHLENYLKTLNAIANSKVLIQGIKQNNFENGSYDIVSRLQEEMWGPSHHIFVTDTKGKIILSPHYKTNLKSTHLGHSIAKSKYFKASLDKTQVTDFYGFEETNHYHQLAMVPIKENGRTLGVIVSEITIQYFIDLLKKDLNLGKTSQIYLSTLNKKKVVHLKSDKIEDIKAPLLSRALSQGSSYGVNQSFRREVLGSYLRSQKFPWILVIEVSKGEVLAPINKATKYISFAYAVFVFVFLLGFKFIINLLKRPIRHASEAIETISLEAKLNSHKMKENTVSMVEGSIQLSEALVENQGQLEKVISEIKEDAGLINDSLDCGKRTQRTAEQGRSIVEEMTRNVSMSFSENENVKMDINKVLADISKIIDSIKLIQIKTRIINEIVFQTKLLSFNASIEAARAGEHGKGFAVVAEEVGNLAEMSGKASTEIHKMIEDSVKQVEDIVKTSNQNLRVAIDSSSEKINKTKESIDNCKNIFQNITENIHSFHNQIDEVAKRTNEKVQSIEEVNDRFISLKNFAEESSASSSLIKSLTQKLEKESRELEKLSDDLSEKFSS